MKLGQNIHPAAALAAVLAATVLVAPARAQQESAFQLVLTIARYDIVNLQHTGPIDLYPPVVYWSAV